MVGLKGTLTSRGVGRHCPIRTQFLLARVLVGAHEAPGKDDAMGEREAEGDRDRGGGWGEVDKSVKGAAGGISGDRRM